MSKLHPNRKKSEKMAKNRQNTGWKAPMPPKSVKKGTERPKSGISEKKRQKIPENGNFGQNDAPATFQRRSSDVPATFQRRFSDVSATFQRRFGRFFPKFPFLGIFAFFLRNFLILGVPSLFLRISAAFVLSILYFVGFWPFLRFLSVLVEFANFGACWLAVDRLHLPQ